MNRATTALALALALTASPADAQQSAATSFAATMDNVAATLARENASIEGGRVTPHWLSDGQSFWFGEERGGVTRALLVDPETGETRPLFDERRLEATLRRLPSEARVAFNQFSLSDDGSQALFEVDGRLQAFSLSDYRIRAARQAQIDAIAWRTPAMLSTQFPTTFGPMFEAPSPNGASMLTLREYDLWVRNTTTGQTRRLTEDGIDRFGWRNTEEANPAFHVAWSPDSTRVAAVKLDVRNVYHMPLMHWMETPERIEPTLYPRSGDPVPTYELYVIDVATGARTALQPLRITDAYVNILGWSSDGSDVYFSVIDRAHSRLEIRAADTATGESRVLITETGRGYIDTPMTLSPPLLRPLARTNQFLFFSERSGWRHLYLYDNAGRLVRQLTDGAFPVTDIVRVDEDVGYIYLRASHDPNRPYDRQLYRVRIAGGALEPLSQGEGMHEIVMSPNGRVFVDMHSTLDRPPVVELRRADGSLIREISRANADALRALGWSAPETFTVPSESGQGDVHGVIYRPYNFDPSRHYPVIESIYGGPQWDILPKHFTTFDPIDIGPYGNLPRYLASQGYVVVFINSPGTPNLGRAYQDAIHRTWPQNLIANHVAALRHAASTRPWMDLDRVGVWGLSWGGYMTQRAMIEAPDFYRVGVSIAPVADFDDHPIYIEPFMGLPDDNRAGYDNASNLTRASDIRGRLLLIPGALDANAPFSASMKMAQAMIDAHRRVDMMILPQSNHIFGCCGPDQEFYVIAYTASYLDEVLRPSPP